MYDGEGRVRAREGTGGGDRGEVGKEVGGRKGHGEGEGGAFAKIKVQ